MHILHTEDNQYFFYTKEYINYVVLTKIWYYFIYKKKNLIRYSTMSQEFLLFFNQLVQYTVCFTFELYYIASLINLDKVLIGTIKFRKEHSSGIKKLRYEERYGLHLFLYFHIIVLMHS